MPPRKEIPWGVVVTVVLALLGAYGTGIVAVRQAGAAETKLEKVDTELVTNKVEHQALKSADASFADLLQRTEKALSDNTKTLQEVRLELAASKKK